MEQQKLNTGTMQSNPSVMQAGYLSLYSDLKRFDDDYSLKYRVNSFYGNACGTVRPKAYNLHGDNTVKTYVFKNARLSTMTVRKSFSHKRNIYDLRFLFDKSVSSEDLSPENKIEVTYTLSEMIDKIKSVFGLPVTNIASIVGVSRATIYNHIASSSAEVTDYSNLFDIAVKIESKGWLINKGVKSVVVEGKTLLKYLNEKPLDTARILKVSQVVAMKLEGMKSSTQPSIDEEKLVAILNNK